MIVYTYNTCNCLSVKQSGGSVFGLMQQPGIRYLKKLNPCMCTRVSSPEGQAQLFLEACLTSVAK